MLTYNQALTRIMQTISSPRTADVTLREALDLILAQRIIAPLDLPPFDNSAVDGYAVCLSAPTSLIVVGCSSAGSPYREVVRPGEAVRIFTGAVIPRGADCVIMQEQVRRCGNRIVLEHWSPHLSPAAKRHPRFSAEGSPSATRQVWGWPEKGRHIRRRGEDLHRGAQVLNVGTRLRPQEIGLLAALGYRRVLVYLPPSVAILATGDELQQPGTRLKPGHIYESNGALLATLVKSIGARLVRTGLARDHFEQLVARIRLELRHDVLLVAGGVSVGEKDLVRAALKACGVKEVFWKVNIKPGMPLFFGKCGRTLVFGLPGNPVSVFVTFEEFVKPALCRLMGRTWQDGYTTPAKITTDLKVSATRRTHFVRVKYISNNGHLTVKPLEGQGAHQLRSLVDADGWIRVVSSQSSWLAGAQVFVKRESVR